MEQTHTIALISGPSLSPPRGINFKFPLQPCQKYYITQYEDLDFHSLLR